MRSVLIALITTSSLLLATPLPAEQLPTTTRKVVLEKAGDGYRWKLIEAAPVPAIGEHQVLMRVRAVALNRGDLEMLEPGQRRDRTGLVAATDAAGDIVAVGKQVKTVRPGARVTSQYFQNWTEGSLSEEKTAATLGSSVDGVLGDYIVLDETAIAPAPAGLSYEEAATLPTAGLTAWNAVNARSELRQGEVVLVQGTGGVSVFALQFAAARGARVIVTSSSDEKLKRMQSLGAKDAINYRTTPAWSEPVLTLTAGRGADLVVDLGGKDSLGESVKSLAYGGTLSIVGGMTGYSGEIPALGLLLKMARAQGVYVGSRADYLRMSEFITRHRLRPVIDRTFALEQYEEALKYMAAGSFVGKIVLRL